MAEKAPRPTVVLMVRHGQTPTTGVVLPGRAAGLHLSDEGRRQADATARRLGALPRIAAVYASPRERARETAAPIARAHQLPVRIDRALDDCHVGEWTGVTLKRLRRRPEWRVIQQSPSTFRFPGGESFVEMQARMASAIARIVAEHRGDIVVVVSHADPIKAAVAQALGVHLDLFQRVAIAPASVTAVAYHDGGPAVLTVNSTGDTIAGVPRR